MWEGTRPPERERGVAWRPHGIMRSSDDGGRRSILIEHSYLNVSESVTAVYIPYIAAHVFQLKVPGCTGGTPGGRLAPPAAVFVCVRERGPPARPRRAARAGAGASELHSSRLAPRGAGGRLGPSFITSYLRSLPRAVPAARAPGGSAADFRGDRLCLSPLSGRRCRHGLHSDSLRD